MRVGEAEDDSAWSEGCDDEDGEENDCVDCVDCVDSVDSMEDETVTVRVDPAIIAWPGGGYKTGRW